MTTFMSAGLRVLRERVGHVARDVGFFGLVRALERELASGADVGSDAPAASERIHFAHSPDLACAASDVVALAYHGDAARAGGEASPLEATVTTSYLGLLGAETPLALSFTEQVLFDDDSGALAAFYDVFHHRAISLLYRTWKRYDAAASYDPEGRDPLRSALLSLVGVDAFSPVAATEGDAAEPMFLLGMSDFSRCEPSYVDIETLAEVLLRLFPDLAPRLGLAEPRFVPSSDAYVTRLGDHRNALGVDATYGAGALDATGVLRLTVGPVDRVTYEDMMPSGGLYAKLWAATDAWLTGRVLVELEVIVAASDAPCAILGKAYGARLGVDARVATAPSSVRIRVPLLADPSLAARTYADDPG